MDTLLLTNAQALCNRTLSQSTATHLVKQGKAVDNFPGAVSQWVYRVKDQAVDSQRSAEPLPSVAQAGSCKRCQPENLGTDRSDRDSSGPRNKLSADRRSWTWIAPFHTRRSIPGSSRARTARTGSRSCGVRVNVRLARKTGIAGRCLLPQPPSSHRAAVAAGRLQR